LRKKKAMKAKAIRNLPAKAPNTKATKGVKGGGGVSLPYEEIKFTYTQQK